MGREEPITFYCLTAAKGTQEPPNLEIWASALAELLVMAAAKPEAQKFQTSICY